MTAATLAAAAVLSGCAAATKDSAKDFTGERKAVAQTVEDLQSASRKHDGAKICSQLLAPALAAKIKAASKDACDTAVKDSLADADSFELQVQKVTISGANATAVVKSEGGDKDRVDTLALVKDRGAWKIATLGAS
jgi:hypothetical protein